LEKSPIVHLAASLEHGSLDILEYGLKTPCVVNVDSFEPQAPAQLIGNFLFETNPLVDCHWANIYFTA
jgi:hypothetical protein